VAVTAGEVLPPGVSFAPPEVRAVADVPAPPPVPVAITARATGVTPARWVDLTRGMAAFAADVEVRVDGPLPPEAKVLVRSPPGVRALAFRPATIRPGTQTVRFEVEANVPTSPKRGVPDPRRTGPGPLMRTPL
jgi:hypothetical protein